MWCNQKVISSLELAKMSSPHLEACVRNGLRSAATALLLSNERLTCQRLVQAALRRVTQAASS